MVGRVLAWCVVFAVCWGIYSYGHTYTNPLTVVGNLKMPAPPVAALLPPLPNGCGPKCKADQ